MTMMMIKFLLLTLLVISPVWAGREVMINECLNAQVPTTCMQCLESDPASANADPVGISGILIRCLESRLRIITNKITNLSSKEDKGEVKEILEACKVSLSNATTELSEAKTGLQTGDYDKAAESIKFALDSPWSCRLKLQNVKFNPFDLDLFSQFSIFAQLVEAIMRIIDRLKG